MLQRPPRVQGLQLGQLIPSLIELACADTLQQIGVAVQEVARRILVLKGNKRPWPATIFRWGRALATNTDRVGAFPVPWEPAFYPDHILPQVSKIVFIEETFVGAEVEVA
jgi:hypothetical protein